MQITILFTGELRPIIFNFLFWHKAFPLIKANHRKKVPIFPNKNISRIILER